MSDRHEDTEPTSGSDGEAEKSPADLLASGIQGMILSVVAFWLAQGFRGVTFSIRENHGLSESTEALAREFGLPVYSVMSDILAVAFFCVGIALVLVSLKLLLDSVRWQFTSWAPNQNDY